jgi:hypothetical protein
MQHIRLKTDETFKNILLQHVYETHETSKIKTLATCSIKPLPAA